MPLASLAPLDLGLIAVYLTATVVWGAWPRKSSDAAEGYLVGGRNVAWPLLLLSIVATETSTVTFLSLPGGSFMEGGDLSLMQLAFGYVAGRLLVLQFMLPEYFRGKMFTAYEMLQERFGQSVRAAASLMFLLCRTSADGLRLFLTALALQQAVGWDFSACVLVIASATTFYATVGGVSSVVKNDCVQIIVYTLGGVIAAWLLIRAVPGGLQGVLEFGEETGRLRVFDWGLGLTGGVTFWSGLVGGAFLSLATHGVDHLMVQRYLCAGSQKKAALALGLSGPVVALQFLLFLMIGVALAAFYAQAEVGYTIDKPDQAFAAFLANETPVGISGLLFASVLAAAMSTLSSSLNASAGVLVKDLLEPARGEVENHLNSLRWARLATVFFGLMQTAVALGAYYAGLKSSVITVVLAIAGFATGILVGLFALGVLRKQASQTAAFAALGTGFVVCTLVIGWGVAVDQGWSWAAGHQKLAWPWNAMVASTTTLLAGLAVDRFAPAKQHTA